MISTSSSPQPDPTEKVHQCWRDDELFGYQFLNGANPMLLRRSASLPSRLVLPPGLEALGAQLERELQVLPPILLVPLALRSAERGGGGTKDESGGGRLWAPTLPGCRVPCWKNLQVTKRAGETVRCPQGGGQRCGFPGHRWSQRW